MVSVRVFLDAPSTSVAMDGHPLPADGQTWDAASHTLLLRFPSAAAGQ